MVFLFFLFSRRSRRMGGCGHGRIVKDEEGGKWKVIKYFYESYL